MSQQTACPSNSPTKMVMALAVALMASSPVSALAQAGATGGSIGKQGKSISGDESPTQQPSEAKRTSSIAGHWLISQKCDRGNFEIELDIRQTSPKEFSGTSRGVTTGTVSQIVGGRIDGNSISFQRQASSMTDRWSARIDRPGHLTGTSKGPLWNCSYTGRRR